MPKVLFTPQMISETIDQDTKILIAARKAKVPLRFGCAACRCGTCAVLISPSNSMSEMRPTERELLTRMKLALDGSVRLSCQARIQEDATIDLAFQDTYSPDDGDDF